MFNLHHLINFGFLIKKTLYYFNRNIKNRNNERWYISRAFIISDILTIIYISKSHKEKKHKKTIASEIIHDVEKQLKEKEKTEIMIF